MKYFIWTCLFGSGGFSFAGPGHGHDHGHHHGHSHAKPKPPIKSAKAQKVGMEKVLKLAKANKIPGSWESATFRGAEKKTFGKREEWVVTFDNPKGAENKKTLFVFLKLNGDFVAANFTGK